MLLLEQILWDRYYHTPWISSMDCCLQREACPFSCIAGTLHYLDACLLWDIVRFRRILVLHCTTRTVGGRSMPPSGLLEGLTVLFFRKHGPGSRPDAGEPVGMEGPSLGI